jgi:hypothetical protein
MAAAIISNNRDLRSVSASGAPTTPNTDRTTRGKTTRTKSSYSIAAKHRVIDRDVVDCSTT